ncbi:MAG: hypothetical protein MHPSP_004271, partial [Paramarteilia canceri]
DPTHKKEKSCCDCQSCLESKFCKYLLLTHRFEYTVNCTFTLIISIGFIFLLFAILIKFFGGLDGIVKEIPINKDPSSLNDQYEFKFEEKDLAKLKK